MPPVNHALPASRDIFPLTYSPEAWQLAQWMAGEFSNRRQSDLDPATFAHIRIFFRPLPWTFFNGIGFYSEQAYDYDLWSPYRQGAHRCLVQDDGSIYIENYGFKDPMLVAGASREDSILAAIAHDQLVPRPCCAMVFRAALEQPAFSQLPAPAANLPGADDLPGAERPSAGPVGPRRYIGQVEPGNGCIIPRDGHQTYLVSEVDLTETTWVSRDRGFDTTTQKQIWGSAAGPLRFDKVRSFASELPPQG